MPKGELKGVYTTRSALETLARPLWMDVPYAEVLAYARMTVALQRSRESRNLEAKGKPD